jgi:hypothetical protein
MATRNAHTTEQKQFIVRRLAVFETPKDIATAFAARFRDTACHEDDVRATDPRLAVVSPDLYSLFKNERERVLLDETLAPFAEQRARLIVLSRQAERYENNNQPAEARAVFRQIAEELGIVGGKPGKSKVAADESATPEVKQITVKRLIVDPTAEQSVL